MHPTTRTTVTDYVNSFFLMKRWPIRQFFQAQAEIDTSINVHDFEVDFPDPMRRAEVAMHIKIILDEMCADFNGPPPIELPKPIQFLKPEDEKAYRKTEIIRWDNQETNVFNYGDSFCQLRVRITVNWLRRRIHVVAIRIEPSQMTSTFNSSDDRDDL